MSTLRHRLAALQQGDHLCLLYDDPAERVATVVEYLRIGLERNEQCLYVCSGVTCGEFLESLRQAGVLTPALEARRAVLVMDKMDSYLLGGEFVGERMVEMLNDAVEAALHSGFTGLRAAGDMTWILDAAPGTDTVAAYEALVNQFYPTARALGLCLYDVNRIPTGALEGAILTHPRAVVDGHICANPFFEPAATSFARMPHPSEIARKVRQIAELRV